MRKLRLILMSGLVIVITAIASHHLYSDSGLIWADDGSGNSDKQIVRVYFPDRYTANKIFITFEGAMIETNYDEKYHIMEVTPEEMALLTDAGLEFEIDIKRDAPGAFSSAGCDDQRN